MSFNKQNSQPKLVHVSAFCGIPSPMFFQLSQDLRVIKSILCVIHISIKTKFRPGSLFKWEAWRNLLLQNYYIFFDYAILSILSCRISDFPAKSSSKA